MVGSVTPLISSNKLLSRFVPAFMSRYLGPDFSRTATVDDILTLPVACGLAETW